MFNLLQLIERYNLHTPSDLYKYGVLKELKHELKQELLKSSRIVNSESNLTRFCAPLSRGEVIELNRLGYLGAAQRLSLYSDKPLFLFPEINFPKSLKKIGKSREYNHKLVRKIDQFLVFPLRDMEKLIRNNVVDVLPRGIGKKRIISPPDFYETITLSNKSLKANLFPSSKIKANSGVFLYLPFMSTIEPNDFFEFKEKYNSDFHEFRLYLDKFLIESKEANSTQKLLDLMKDVHDGVIVLNSQVREHQERLTRKGIKVFSGLITISLSLMTEIQVAKQLFSVLGGISIYDGVWNYYDTKKALNPHRSDFYIPWLIGEELQGDLKEQARQKQLSSRHSDKKRN